MNKLNHVAFIMDGNGRWGQKRNKGRNFGHLNGVKTVKKIVESSINLKIPTRAIYHPAYLLRNPIEKKKIWDDLIDIYNFLNKNNILNDNEK